MEIVIPTWAVTLLVCFIGGLVAFAVARYNAYRTASAKFRDIVLRELCDFYPVFTRWHGASFENELSAKFPTLQAAVNDFSSNLSLSNSSAFLQAWLSYCNTTGRECDINTYLHYYDAYGPGETQAGATAKAQALFHSHISHLLSFASQT